MSTLQTCKPSKIIISHGVTPFSAFCYLAKWPRCQISKSAREELTSAVQGARVWMWPHSALPGEAPLSLHINLSPAHRTHGSTARVARVRLSRLFPRVLARFLAAVLGQDAAAELRTSTEANARCFRPQTRRVEACRRPLWLDLGAIPQAARGACLFRSTPVCGCCVANENEGNRLRSGTRAWGVRAQFREAAPEYVTDEDLLREWERSGHDKDAMSAKIAAWWNGASSVTSFSPVV